MSERRRGRITIQNQPPRETRIVNKLSLIPALIVGVFFVCVGCSFLVLDTGAFGLVWTLLAVFFTGRVVFELVRKNGLPQRVGYDVEDGLDTEAIVGLLDEAGETPPGGDRAARRTGARPSDPESRMRQLKALYEQSLISEAEYEEKRREILREL